jgi:hypothetical protein
MVTPTLGYRLAALTKVWSVAWPTRAAFKQKLKVLRANSRTALRHPHLFDDRLQRARLSRFADLVKGRTVAVVGNAQYLLESDAGSEIEKHDVVIRFNHGFVVSPTSQGTRTEVHCLATNVAVDELARHCPNALILYASPVRSYLNDDFKRDATDCICIPLGDWRQLVQALGNQRPSAGFVIVDYLLHRSDAIRVSIYGFDWKRTKSFYHQSKIRDWHSGEAERKLLLRWASMHASRLSFGNCPMGPPA